MLSHCQMGEKGVQLGFPHLTWMSLIMEKNITLNPMRIGFFGTNAIVTYTYCVTDLIEKFGLFHDCLLALFDFLFRLPYWELILVFITIRLYIHPKSRAVKELLGSLLIVRRYHVVHNWE